MRKQERKKEFYLIDAEMTSESVIYYIGVDCEGKSEEVEVEIWDRRGGGARIEIRDERQILENDLDLSEVLRIVSDRIRWCYLRSQSHD